MYVKIENLCDQFLNKNIHFPPKMGALLSRIIFGYNDIRILLLGLDSAGKTTLLYKLKLGTIIETIPTIGFNLEAVNYKNMTMTIWDVGGQDKLRQLWKHYYQDTKVIIFMIDVNDKERIELASEEFYKVVNDATAREKLKHVIIYANKADLVAPGDTINISYITELFKLDNLRSNGIESHIQECSALNGNGVYEGLDKLRSMLNNSK